jgi:hypothetical protein
LRYSPGYAYRGPAFSVHADRRLAWNKPAPHAGCLNEAAGIAYGNEPGTDEPGTVREAVWIQDTLDGLPRLAEETGPGKRDGEPATSKQRETEGQLALGLTPETVHAEIPEQVVRIRRNAQIAQAKLDDLAHTPFPGGEQDELSPGEAWPVIAGRERDAVLHPPKPDVVPPPGSGNSVLRKLVPDTPKPSQADDLAAARNTVLNVTALRVPEQMPSAIARSRPLVDGVLAQSLAEVGTHGRAALAWEWALTGTRPSPVTLSLPIGHPPSRDEIVAEATAEPDGSTTQPGVPSDYCGQLGEARRVLTWLAGQSDEIPVDDDNRGRFVGARDDYARTDDDIRQARDDARRGLEACDLPDPMDPHDARNPWRWDAGWMNAAWLRGARDLLDWVLGERAVSPLRRRLVGLPSTYDLTYEDGAAEDVILQGRPAGRPVDPAAYPPPQYGEGVQAAIQWLRGETTTPPAGQDGCGAYTACREKGPR